MNISQIRKFLKIRQALTVAGIEREAGIKGLALAKALSLGEELSDKNLKKILPVLNSYGFNNITQKAKIVAVVNNKGGVGKTTTTAILAEAMSRRGLRVLIIDLDSQGNLSQIFDVSTEKGQVADSLIDFHVPLNQVKINPNLFIVPSDLSLQEVESKLLTAVSNQNRLNACLNASIVDNYDYILIDCPPSLGLLTLNAINASHSCLITVVPESSAVVGLDSIFKLIATMNAYNGKTVTIEGVLFTMVENTIVHKTHQEFVRESYKNVKIFNTVIKKNVDVTKAQASREPIFEYDNRSVSAMAYNEVIEEII